MSKLRFDGKTVLVTGGSRGLGRAFCLAFAKLGANVVINSLGGADEDYPEKSAAEITLAKIACLEGNGAAIDCSVLEAERLVDFCKQSFGGLDVVVHNAGVVRDGRLSKQSDQDWRVVNETSLDAGFQLTRAVWPLFQQQGAGRLLFVSSSSGLYGNFGQANYSAAKAGLIGLAKAVALEGARYGIHANVVAPVAVTQMNRDFLPPDSHELLTTERVAPIVAWLCHSECGDNGSVYEVAGGWVGKVRWERSAGFEIAKGAEDLESIADQWAEAADFAVPTHPDSAMESLEKVLAGLSG